MGFLLFAGPLGFGAVTACLGAVGMVAPTLIGTLLGIPRRAPYWHYRFGTGWLEDQEDVLDEPAGPPAPEASAEDEGTPATPEEVGPGAEAPAPEEQPVGGTPP
jgi:hypothetical protein